jgi:hypothetical protein
MCWVVPLVDAQQCFFVVLAAVWFCIRIFLSRLHDMRNSSNGDSMQSASILTVYRHVVLAAVQSCTAAQAVH